MQRQDEISTGLNQVAEKQRSHMWRDRFVGALLAMGIAVGAVTIEVAARTANAATVPVATTECADSQTVAMHK